MAKTFQPDKEVAQEKLEQLRSSLREGARGLLEELRQGKSERLQALLTYSSRFYRYSPANQRLIQQQCIAREIDAEHVASFTDWKARNYTVRKGERGISIYQPRPYREIDKNGEEKKKVFFRTVSVFANTQVEPLRPDAAPIQTFFVKLEGDCEMFYARLAEVVQADGIELIEEEATYGQGYSAKGLIGLKKGLNSRNSLLTLIHEYAHELMHNKENRKTLTKRVKECQAEAVSFIVSYHFGVHNPFSSDYLQTWGNDETSLMEEIELVQKTAAYIITRMEEQAEKAAA